MFNDKSACRKSLYMLRVKFDFRLNFFNLGWFSICLVFYLALITYELGLGDKGKNKESA